MAYLPATVARHGRARLRSVSVPLLLALAAGGIAAGIGLMPRSLQPFAIEGAVFFAAGALLRDVRRLLLACVIADTGLGLDRYFNYQEDLAVLGAIAGLGVSLTTVFIVVLWLVELGVPKARRTISTDVRVFRWAVLAYALAVVLSFRVAPDKSLVLNAVAVLAPAMLVALYLLRSTLRRRDVEFVLAVMFAVGILEGVLALTLGGSPRDTSIGPLHITQIFPGRFSGTFGHPNTAGAYLELVLLPAIAVAAAPVHANLRRLAVVAAAFSGIAIVLSFSRGAWIAVLVGSVIFAVAGVRRKWFRARAPLALGLCAVACLTPVAGTIVARVSGNDDGAAQSRVILARLAERIIRNDPIFGVGANNYAVSMQGYRTPDVSGTWDYIVHSKYLLVWGETGAIGLIAFIAILAVALRAGARASRATDKATAMIAVGLSSALIGSMAHMLVDTFQGRAEMTNLLTVAALLVVLSRLAAGLSAEKR